MVNVRRTSLNLDLARVDRARAVLGTTTTTDTVHAALDEVARQAALRALFEYDFSQIELLAEEDPWSDFG